MKLSTYRIISLDLNYSNNDHLLTVEKTNFWGNKRILQYLGNDDSWHTFPDFKRVSYMSSKSSLLKKLTMQEQFRQRMKGKHLITVWMDDFEKITRDLEAKHHLTKGEIFTQLMNRRYRVYSY